MWNVLRLKTITYQARKAKFANYVAHINTVLEDLLNFEIEQAANLGELSISKSLGFITQTEIFELKNYIKDLPLYKQLTDTGVDVTLSVVPNPLVNNLPDLTIGVYWGTWTRG